nr:unnamed protein product [Digitaria exilis]
MAPFVPDDVLLQILLRLPPRPSCLLRASLVCKRWHALVTDPTFLRRLRSTPATTLLGVFINNPPINVCFVPSGDPPDRVPASRFRRPELPWLVRDSRRGRVLLFDDNFYAPRSFLGFLVWDPVTDATRSVPRPPFAEHFLHLHGFGAVLLPDEHDDDTGASGGFRVAVAFVVGGNASAAVYSAATGAWGNEVTAQIAPFSGSIQWTKTPGVVVGDSVCWLIDGGGVLSLKLSAGGDHVLVVLKPRNAPRVHDHNVKLMRTRDGELGLATVTGNALRLWALEEDDGSGGGGGDTVSCTWTLRRKLLLEELFPGPRRRRSAEERFGEVRSLALAVVLLDPTPCARIVGVDEDGVKVFLHRKRMDDEVELFMLELEAAPRMKKIRDSYYMRWYKEYDTVYAFAGSFF